MKRLVLASLLIGVLPALAQEDLRIDQGKVYVTEPAACQALEEKGVDAWMDLDFLSLTFPGGIQSMEYHCNFFDVKGREGSSHLVAQAICELPGELYPDLMAIAPYDERTIMVVSSNQLMLDYSGAMAGAVPAESEIPPVPGATLFTRCDTLSEIPFD